MEQFLDLGDIGGKARQAGATGRQRKAGRQKEGTSGAAGAGLPPALASKMPQNLWERMLRKVEKMKKVMKKKQVGSL